MISIGDFIDDDSAFRVNAGGVSMPITDAQIGMAPAAEPITGHGNAVALAPTPGTSPHLNTAPATTAIAVTAGAGASRLLYGIVVGLALLLALFAVRRWS